MSARRRVVVGVWLLALASVGAGAWRALERGFAVHAQNPRLAAAPRGAIRDVRGRVLAEGPVRARRYPAGAAAVHVVGYKPSLAVSAGMEARADRFLSVPATALPPLLDRSAWRPPDLRLTLDLDWQRAAYRALGPRAGAVVVLDARDGAVVASVSRPGFAPEGLAHRFRALRDDPDEPFRDRALDSRAPPGSTFKLLMARHLLASGQGRFRSFCTGRVVTPDGHAIRCTRPHGDVDLARALAVSCNGYFVRAALERVGGSARDTYRRVLGPGFAGEADFDRAVGRALLAIGQGNARVAPVRMAAFVATLFGGAGGDAGAGGRRAGRSLRPVLVASGPTEAEPLDWDVPVPEPEVRERLAALMDGAAAGVRRRLRLSGRCALLGAKTGTAEAPVGGDFAWLVGAVRAPEASGGTRTLAFAIVLEGIQGLSIQHTPAVLERTLRGAVPACR